MKILLWLLLLFISAPLAITALFLYPIIWIILLPFRLAGITVDAIFIFDLLGAILKLPAKIMRGI